jgi:acyl carrier protein
MTAPPKLSPAAERETQAVVGLLEKANLQAADLFQLLLGQGFVPQGEPQVYDQTWRGQHGWLQFHSSRLIPGLKVIDCIYMPTDKSTTSVLVMDGISASGWRLPEADLRRIRELRAKEAAFTNGLSSSERRVFDLVREYLPALIDVGRDMPLDDIRDDPVLAIEVPVALESELGVDIDEDFFDGIQTLADLFRFAEGQR